MGQAINLKQYKIPKTINFIVAIMAFSSSIALLYLAERSEHWYTFLLYAICFSFTQNTIFSLLHESVHGVFHPNRTINNWMGRISGAFFPTAFTMQQIYHLGHHRRNRTDAEMFDLYYEGDNLLMKKIVIFCILTGFYWPSSLIACFIYLIFPEVLTSERFRNSKFNKAFSFDAMLKGLDRFSTPVTLIRGEILFMIAIQASLFYFLDLSFLTWLGCYWVFGINWGGLQYTDHAFSERDVRNGAWNLKVNPIVKKIFLNYHCHLVHHRYPSVPWIHLPKLVDPNDGQVDFFKIYFKLWKGPFLAKSNAPEYDHQFDKVLLKGTILESSAKK
jgi:fatty acid desaturase